MCPVRSVTYVSGRSFALSTTSFHRVSSLYATLSSAHSLSGMKAMDSADLSIVGHKSGHIPRGWRVRGYLTH